MGSPETPRSVFLDTCIEGWARTHYRRRHWHRWLPPGPCLSHWIRPAQVWIWCILDLEKLVKYDPSFPVSVWFLKMSQIQTWLTVHQGVIKCPKPGCLALENTVHVPIVLPSYHQSVLHFYWFCFMYPPLIFATSNLMDGSVHFFNADPNPYIVLFHSWILFALPLFVKDKPNASYRSVLVTSKSAVPPTKVTTSNFFFTFEIS